MSVRLETDRLVLRVPRADDAEAAAGYLADPEVMSFLGGSTVPREDVPGVIEKWLRDWQANGFGTFAVERREDGRWVGRVGLTVWHGQTWHKVTVAEAGVHPELELGWTLARAHWGCGYATEAAVAVREWSRELYPRRLISLINPQNVRSRAVAERLGATTGETVTLFDGSAAVAWEHPQ